MFLGSTPTNFFLKENNCIDGKHYYALVEAVVRKYKITEGDKSIHLLITDSSLQTK